MKELYREGAALVAAVLAVGALVVLMAVLLADEQWWCAALLAGALALAGLARWLGRYDPERASEGEAARGLAELRNRARSG